MKAKKSVIKARAAIGAIINLGVVALGLGR